MAPCAGAITKRTKRGGREGGRDERGKRERGGKEGGKETERENCLVRVWCCVGKGGGNSLGGRGGEGGRSGGLGWRTLKDFGGGKIGRRNPVHGGGGGRERGGWQGTRGERDGPDGTTFNYFLTVGSLFYSTSIRKWNQKCYEPRRTQSGDVAGFKGLARVRCDNPHSPPPNKFFPGTRIRKSKKKKGKIISLNNTPNDLVAVVEALCNDHTRRM